MLRFYRGKTLPYLIMGVAFLACIVTFAWSQVTFPPPPGRYQRLEDIDTEHGYKCRVYVMLKPFSCVHTICDQEQGKKVPAVSCR